MTKYELWNNLLEMMTNQSDIFGIEDFSDVLAAYTLDDAESAWTAWRFAGRTYVAGDVLMTSVGRVVIETLPESGDYFYIGIVLQPSEGSGYQSRDQYQFNDTDVSEYLDHIELSDLIVPDDISGDEDNNVTELTEEELEELLNGTTDENTIGGDDDNGGE